MMSGFCLSIFFLNFSATVTNLQAKVESLTTTNALMKEDLSIARNSYLALQYENKQLKKELGIEVKDPIEVQNFKTNSLFNYLET